MTLWTTFQISQHTFVLPHAQGAWKYLHGEPMTPPEIELYGEGLMVVAAVVVQKRFRLVNDWYQEEYAMTIVEKLFGYYLKAGKVHMTLQFPTMPTTDDEVKKMYGNFYWKADKEAMELVKVYRRRVKKLRTSFIQDPAGSVKPMPKKFADSINVMPLNLEHTIEQTFIEHLKEKMLLLGLTREDLRDYTPFSSK